MIELKDIMINQALYDTIEAYGKKNNMTTNEAVEKLVGIGYTCEKYGGVFVVNKPKKKEKAQAESDNKTPEVVNTVSVDDNTPQAEETKQETTDNQSVNSEIKEDKKRGGVKINFNN